MSGGRTTVVYDGECSFCRRSIDVLKRLDREGVLDFVPSQSPGVRERFPWISDEAYDRAIQVVEPDGRSSEGAAAMERLCHIVPAGQRVGWVYRIPFARQVADRVYGWISRNRNLVPGGCGEHCRRS